MRFVGCTSRCSDTSLMRVAQSVSGLTEIMSRHFDGQRPRLLHLMLQIDTPHVLHHHVELVIATVDIKDVDDIAMIECSHFPRIGQEPLHDFRVIG